MRRFDHRKKVPKALLVLTDWGSISTWPARQDEQPKGRSSFLLVELVQVRYQRAFVA